MLAPLGASGEDLLLAPGRSVTLLDAANPMTRVVITAPPNAPLDLSALLGNDPKEGIHSIVTRIQLHQARGITANADGTFSLSRGAPPAPSPKATVLEGGVIVYDAGRYTVHAARPADAAAPAPRPAAPASGQVQISKPGVARERAERDLRQCRVYAESASAQFVTASHRSAMYNMAMASCLRAFGYDLRSSGG
jgi:hypothetical protein